MNARKNKGFTLIELMIVIAILSILLAIAIPAYQDYSIRAKVSEGIYAIAPVKLAVTDAILSGLEPSATDFDTSSLQTTFVDSISIANDGSGTITVTTRNTGASTDPAFALTPSTVNPASVSWKCHHLSGETAHLPASCR